MKLFQIENSKKLKYVGDLTKVIMVQKCNRNQYQGHRPVEIDPLPKISTFPKRYIFFSRKGQSVLIVGLDVSPFQSLTPIRGHCPGEISNNGNFWGTFFCPSFPTSFCFTWGAKRWVGNPRGEGIIISHGVLKRPLNHGIA